MATPHEDIYAAALKMLGDVNTAATGTLAAAPTDYGSDFRIQQGTAMWQIQLTSVPDYGANSNQAYPRAIVTILIHHYATTHANEKEFTLDAMSHASDILMVNSLWQAEAGVYGFEPDVSPDVSDGERVGNVITFEITASVLADPT